MIIENKYFKRRDDIRSFSEDNLNIFRVTYFKESGKYYTEEYYELTHEYKSGIWEFPDHFKEYCKDYKGTIAVINFNDKHQYGYPFMVLANERI